MQQEESKISFWRSCDISIFNFSDVYMQGLLIDERFCDHMWGTMNQDIVRLQVASCRVSVVKE